jgi:very-short-patch-repair endonuclease
MARGFDGAVADLAPKTLGLLTTRQLDDLGVGRHVRSRLVAHGVLAPVATGVWRHVAHPRSWHQSLLGAVLAAGDRAVASHLAAAALTRFDGIAPGALDVTVPADRRPRSIPGTLHRARRLGPADVDRSGLIPRTSAVRTLVDIAALVDAATLEAALDGAERDGTIWRPQLRWYLAGLRSPGCAARPGVAAVERLLAETEGRPLGDTWLEQQAIRVLRAAGLPLPRTQVVLGGAGRRRARVDLFWDDARLVVELAGHATHATRRQRQADDERAARLGLAGWRVVEFTYEDVVERPDYVVAVVAAYLAA